MGVPVSPFLGFLVGVGPAEGVEVAFSLFARSSAFLRFCNALNGGLGRDCGSEVGRVNGEMRQHRQWNNHEGDSLKGRKLTRTGVQ